MFEAKFTFLVFILGNAVFFCQQFFNKLSQNPRIGVKLEKIYKFLFYHKI